MHTVITRHLEMRFRERFPDYTNEEEHVSITIKKLVRESSENNSFLNDPIFCQTIYEKHGYHTRYRFFDFDNRIIFVFKEDNSNLVGVTCFPKPDKTFAKIKKFSRIKKKSEIALPLDMMPKKRRRY